MHIINFDQARLTILKKRYIPRVRRLGQFLEYCLIPEYDETDELHTLERVQVDDVRVHLLWINGRYRLASILFDAEDFSLEGVLNWLFAFGILLDSGTRAEHGIDDALAVEFGLTFSGQPLVKYSRGPCRVHFHPEEFDEVLEAFDQSEPVAVDFGEVEYDCLE